GSCMAQRAPSSASDTLALRSASSSRLRSRILSRMVDCCCMDIPLSVLVQKIFQELVPVFGKNRLGMELHSFHRQRAMPNAHDFFDGTVVVLGPRGYLQAGGQAVLLDDQRMVAGGIEWRGKGFEHAFVKMVNGGSLAVHHALGPNDIATKGFA